jgi:hypothetical protein
MNESFPGEGVRRERVNTSAELEASLARLPNGVRFGIVCDLEERGRALRLHAPSQCVYHLHWEKDDIVILTWGPMTTLLEATILLSSIKSLTQPLDDETALRLYRAATSHDTELRVEPKRHTPVSSPRPWTVERFTSLQITLQRLYRSIRPRWRSPLPASRTATIP